MILEEMKIIAKNENVIFYKPGCPFCVAAENLFKKLVELSIIPYYKICLIDSFSNNQDLTTLVKEYGWKPEGYQEVCTKPQIFINGEYIGGNRELYLSKWNLGEEGTGKIRNIEAPKVSNPMKF